MLEEGEIVRHSTHGVCVVIKVYYQGDRFQGATLRPTTAEGQRTLRQASLSKTGQFFETNRNLIQGA